MKVNRRVQKSEIMCQRVRLLNRLVHPAMFAPFEDVYATIEALEEWLSEHDSGFVTWWRKHDRLYMMFLLLWDNPRQSE